MNKNQESYKNEFMNSNEILKKDRRTWHSVITQYKNPCCLRLIKYDTLLQGCVQLVQDFCSSAMSLNWIPSTSRKKIPREKETVTHRAVRKKKILLLIHRLQDIAQQCRAAACRCSRRCHEQLHTLSYHEDIQKSQNQMNCISKQNFGLQKE